MNKMHQSINISFTNG